MDRCPHFDMRWSFIGTCVRRNDLIPRMRLRTILSLLWLEKSERRRSGGALLEMGGTAEAPVLANRHVSL